MCWPLGTGRVRLTHSWTKDSWQQEAVWPALVLWPLPSLVTFALLASVPARSELVLLSDVSALRVSSAAYIGLLLLGPGLGITLIFYPDQSSCDITLTSHSDKSKVKVRRPNKWEFWHCIALWVCFNPLKTPDFFVFSFPRVLYLLFIASRTNHVCPIDFIKTILWVSESDWHYDWLIKKVAQFSTRPKAHPNEYLLLKFLLSGW